MTFEPFAEKAARGASDAGDAATYVVQMPGSDVRPAGTRHYDELYAADDTGEIEPANADDLRSSPYSTCSGC